LAPHVISSRYASEAINLEIVADCYTQELLKYKSHQISPTEVEAILGQCPGVADVAVIGVPDGEGNDLPRAYIVTSASVSEKDINEFLNPKVSVYKRLRGGVVFVNEIPRNHNAKIMRNVLKEWVEKDGTDSPRAKL
jgi:acyl-coenzyme A synthetase/AMP-(fatty) acid ligase